MAMTMRILLIIISILQMLFPFIDFNVPEEPTEETTTAVIEETTTEEQPTFDEGCRHAGGKATCFGKAVCELCGAEYGEKVEHNYITFVTEATCEKDGYTTYKCEFCGDTYRADEVKATGHAYETVVLEATCTEAGKSTHTCKNCGYSYITPGVPALGHKYTKTETAADCVNPGYFVYTCENCGDVYKELSGEAAGDHNYVAVVTVATCRNGGYTTHTCTGCNDSYVTDETPALGHSFTNYVPDNNATCTMDGTKTAYCDHGCGIISTLFIEGSQLDHSDADGDGLCDYCKTEMS